MIPLRVLVVLLAAWLAGGCASAAPPATAERGITVMGTGRVASRPDTAVIHLGVEARALQLSDATADVDRKMRDVVARIKELGVRDADIRTSTYSIVPVGEPRQPRDAGAEIVGYQVSNIAEIRTRDVGGVARIVEAAVAAGANVVRGIHFTVGDPGKAEVEARALALKDAAAKAQQLAAAAGVKLGRLVAVTESPQARPIERMVLSAPGPVEPGQLEVTVTLEARYAIDPP